MIKKRLKVRLSGRVQGVSFRYFTQRKAIELGLGGWVRNESDGDVLLVAEGEQEPLGQLLEYVRSGPNLAQVERCEPLWSEAEGEFEEFRIRH